MSDKKGKLKQDTMFKSKVPTMPEGYYSGDQPNPYLREFVENHLKEKPYDPETDDYNVPAFDKPIESTKATAIYNMHTYWSKKPHDAIRQYIKHYTEPGDLILDPFCGSGGTALVALMEGRKAIAIDRSPAAAFITKCTAVPVDDDEFNSALSQISDLVKPYFDLIYSDNCPICNGKAIIGYTVYSKTIECIKCMNVIPIYPNGDPSNNKCPICGEIFSGKESILGEIPVRQTRRCISGCGKKSESLGNNNIKVYTTSVTLPEWYDHKLDKALETEFPIGLITRQPISSGAKSVKDIYSSRNLLAAKLLLSAIQQIDCAEAVRELLKLTFNGISLNISKMLRETKRAIQSGTYYLPPLYRELHVWNAFKYKANQILAGMNQIKANMFGDIALMISCQSATDLSNIPSDSIDYIFTDPPYGAKVQFAEANFVWEVWQGFDTHWWNDEIIVNEPRTKDEEEWMVMISEAFKESYRVLKPGRNISICFHGEPSIWGRLQDAINMIGFVPEHSSRVIYIDAREKSYKQRTADNVQLRDLVINFRKPHVGELADAIIISDVDDHKTFREKVHIIIRDYLSANPGSTKDRIYDEVVSRMVRRGQMETHNFDELLQQVAEEIKEPFKKNLFENQDPDLFGTHEIGRWYLKETELDVVDEAETVKEDAAARSVAAFIENWLKKNPHKEGVHFSDIFEHYIYAVKDKPRRQLQDLLSDYFYKTTEGTYRLPANGEEEEAKAKGRLAGINRRIKRYVAYLTQGVPIPEKERPGDATLAEWIRQCKLTGLYLEGKTIFEKGGLDLNHLSEEAQVNVEEDYQVCLRLLSRA